MKNIALTLISFFILTNSFSQKISHDYGKISAGDFAINSFLGDTSVEAIVLYDIGSSKFIKGSDGFDILFERRTKIKILSKAGIEHSEIGIPLYQEGSIHEKLYKLEGASYNLENGKIEIENLDKKDVYEEKINESWVLKKFAMPAVKEGTIIEFKYEVVTPDLFNLQDWEFQRDIPTLYSEYVVRSIPFFSYVYIKQGIKRLNQESSVVDNGLERTFASAKYHDVINTYVLVNVPAFEDESFITSRGDYIKKMDFQLAKITYPDGRQKDIITTWPQLCNKLLNEGDFAKFLSKSEKKSGSLIDLSKYNFLSDEEKVKQAVDFVKTNFRWNGRHGYFPQKEHKEFINEKVGNDANINLFLTALLQSVGMDAHPVIMSTREHGKINKTYPFSHYFNYVLSYIKIENGYLLVDATDEKCSYNQIPFKCLNGIGLVVKKDSEEWVSLNNDAVSEIERNMKLSFSNDVDSLKGDFTILTTNYDATNFRRIYGENPNEFENQLSENNLKLLDSIEVENYNDLSNPYKINFKAECPYEKIGNKIFVSPFLNEPMSKNPFKQDDRTYPIDMNYVKSRKFASEINIPKGYTIQELPETYSMNNKWMVIIYVVDFNDKENKLKIAAQYTTKKAVYNAEDFRNLKFMYDEMIKKFNEKIIFTKVEEDLSSSLD